MNSPARMHTAFLTSSNKQLLKEIIAFITGISLFSNLLAQREQQPAQEDILYHYLICSETNDEILGIFGIPHLVK